FFSAPWPAACLRSITIERLLRFKCRNLAPMPGVTDFPFRLRTRSPDLDSTLITSAPWSARIWVHNGPTTTDVRSTTCTPSSGPPDICLFHVLADPHARHTGAGRYPDGARAKADSGSRIK